MMRLRPIKSERRSGFTLLELMFSMTILSIGVMAAFSSQMGSRNVVSSSHETTAATMDLEAALETMLATGSADLIVAQFPTGVPIATFNDLHLEGEQMVPTYPNFVGVNVPTNLEVRLTVTWNDFNGGTRSQSLSTAVTR